MDNLPIVEKTKYLNLRELNGERVMTYQDLADAYQVSVSTIKKAFTRNKENWPKGRDKMSPPEISTAIIDTAGGPQATTVFNFRGAIRIAFHIKSGVADQVQSHLLDLIEAEAKGQIRIEQTPQNARDSFESAMAQLARITGFGIQNIQAEQAQLTARIDDLSQQVANVGKVDRDVVAHNVLTRIQELDTSKAYLKKVVWAIVARARSADDNDLFSKPFRSYQATWHAVYDAAVPVVSKLEKYTTKAQINTSIDAAERLLVRMGGTLPPRQLEMQEVVVGV